MEKVLRDIAFRVTTTNLNQLAHTQEYEVEMRVKSKNHRSHETAFVTTWQYNAQQIVMKEITSVQRETAPGL